MVSRQFLLILAALSPSRIEGFFRSPIACGSWSRVRLTTRQTEIYYNGSKKDESNEHHQTRMGRRSLLQSSTLLIASAVTITTASPAQAYQKIFPGELKAADGIMDERQLKLKFIRQQEAKKKRSLIPEPLSAPTGALLWGAALWLLGGSRSNPIVTPVANVFYNAEQESWLKDRNDGLFADLPSPLLGIVMVIFVGIGFGADRLLTFLADGNHNASLQLAGVTLISAGALELGRIASGEKKMTREETDRGMGLEEEFAEFASKRLKRGGNCHRNEVVGAFRRYYAKYRQPDNPDYPVSDLEIEQLLRAWGRSQGLKMTTAGFYYGVKINRDADVFV